MEYISTKLTRELVIDSIVSVHYFEYPLDFYFEGESHDFWEIIYCDKGKICIKADNREILLSRGQAFLHPPKQFHDVRVTGNESANSIVLSFVSDSASLYEIGDRVLNTEFSIVNMLFSLLRESQASFENPLGKLYDMQLVRTSNVSPFASEQIIQNYMELLFIYLIRAERSKEQAVPNLGTLPGAETANALLEAVVQYMKEHLDSKITFAELASKFSVSATTLKKLFRKHYSSGTIEYLITLRIEKAKELLRDGQLSCTEIATRCGFCSIHHFSKAFKESTGMSPTEYTKSVKSLLEDAPPQRAQK